MPTPRPPAKNRAKRQNLHCYYSQGKTIDLWYSGKAGEHGGTIHALSAPNGFALWVLRRRTRLDTRPHRSPAARAAGLYAAASRGLPTLADGGYDGTGSRVHTPITQPPGPQVLDTDTRTYNALLRGLRSLGERGFAMLTGRWPTLDRITASHHRATSSGTSQDTQRVHIAMNGSLRDPRQPDDITRGGRAGLGKIRNR